jgi:hypothetical protein
VRRGSVRVRRGSVRVRRGSVRVRRVSVGSMVALPPRPSLKKIFKNEK